MTASARPQPAVRQILRLMERSNFPWNASVTAFPNASDETMAAAWRAYAKKLFSRGGKR